MNTLSKEERQKLVKELSQKLVDSGKLIEAGFCGFRVNTIPINAPDYQVQEMRIAFMAGATYLFGSIIGILEPGVEPTENDMSRMEMISKELDMFSAEMRVKGAPKG